MSLLYPFSEKFKEDFFPVIAEAFNEQRATRLDPNGFILMMTVPVSKKDNAGFVMVTKRTDDFLRLRLRFDKYADYTAVGEFKMKHEMNFASSLFEIFWETEMILDRSKFQEIGQAIRSELYQAWLKADHIIRLENGGKLMTEYNSFVKHQL